MNIMVKITVPNYIYRFYQQASRNVADCTAEDIMADALKAYAAIISEEVAKENKRTIPSSQDADQ